MIGTHPVWRRGKLVAGLIALAALIAARGQAAEKPHAFEQAIQTFEAQDLQTPPPERPILFVGGSSIRLWNLAKWFPNLPVLNRGFGGSQIADSVYFADRIVIKYRPSVIVFYAGDNDLAGGKSPEQVASDFREFVAKVRPALPDTRIIYIAIKPSPARWNQIDRARTANGLIATFAKSDPLVTFIDVEKPMLDSEGNPRSELFVADKLHLNATGYDLWTSLLLPHLKP
jgi:lysophospholipase L1-like esterase